MDMYPVDESEFHKKHSGSPFSNQVSTRVSGGFYSPNPRLELLEDKKLTFMGFDSHPMKLIPPPN